MSDRDDIDPNDWLASQFEDEPEPIKPPQPAAAQPTSEFRPADGLPAAGPSAVPPVNQPSGEPAGGFVWGLTPGGGDSAPIEPPAPEPIPSWPAVALSAAPALPPAAVMPTAPALPPAAVLPPAPALPPAEAFPPAPGGAGERWNYDPLEQPTRAIEQPGSAFQQPGPVLEQPGSAIERAPLPWETPAVDYSLQGATEAMWAEPIGLADPVDEGVEASAIDSLFGHTQFRDYADDPVIGPPPTRRPAEPPWGPDASDQPLDPGPPRAPLARSQKTLLWVAGSLVAVLALVAVFLLGSRLAPTIRPVPVAVPIVDATATPAPPGVGQGPLAPGEYTWSELRGGECLDPWESAWQDTYVVVDCATPHRAQLAYRGVFDDPVGTPYPGVDALQARTLPLCSAPTAIDFTAAAGATDLQVFASFAGNEQEWLTGNPSFFCFAARAGGEPLTGSIAAQPAAQ